MKITASVFAIAGSMFFAFLQQPDYRDSLKIAGLSGYNQSVKLQPNKTLVDIQKFVPGIKLDIRYATTNNFMHQRMYNQARAFARLPVVNALIEVQAELKTKGLGLKIYDAYRPYSVTVKFYEKASDKNFVADPKKGSRHNRGCAIDLSIINLTTGRELDMPTPFDSFSPKAAADYAELPPQVIQNRQLLISTMERHGFKVLSNEWWHFDFNGWTNFELLDIPFNSL